jgi:urease accessory protein
MIRVALAIFVALVPSAASAHIGMGDSSGFVHGFSHPIGGIDHILAMVAVGLFAAHLGGRAIWLVPLSFVSTMAAAGVLGMAGVQLPYVEIGIGLSVIVLGLAIAVRLDLPTSAATALVAFFAIFHGHAHGAEVPDDVSGLAYGAGFVSATALLHVAGIGVGLMVGYAGQTYGSRLLQIGGGAISLAGLANLAGSSLP